MSKKKATQPVDKAGPLFGGQVQPDLFYNGPISQSTLQRKRERQEYYVINYLNKDKGFKPDKKTFIDYAEAMAWGRANLQDEAHIFHPDMITSSYEPTKYQDKHNPDCYYWAEPNEIDGGKSFCVTFQADGYPATAGHDDWFGTFEGADQVAYALSQGEDLFW